jgi:hypothetical protein
VAEGAARGAAPSPADVAAHVRGLIEEAGGTVDYVEVRWEVLVYG